MTLDPDDPMYPVLHHRLVSNKFAEVEREMNRQDVKWGPAEQLPHISIKWLALLTEEVGELAQALNDGRQHDAYAELGQVAALAMNWMTVYGRNE